MKRELSELEGLRRLDPRILAEIHKRYYPEVYRYARYRLEDESAAEDISSEVFLLLLEAVKNGGGPTQQIRGWLMGTVANLVNNYYRRMYAHPVDMLSDNLHSPNSNPAALTEEQEQIRGVRSALANLTPEQQHVLALRFGDGFSLEEVAEIMGKNANSVKALQFRALASLRRFLQEKGD